MKLEYFYDIIKKEDGETYIKCKSEKTVFEYQIGEAKVVVDKLLFGDVDFSKYGNHESKFLELFLDAND